MKFYWKVNCSAAHKTRAYRINRNVGVVAPDVFGAVMAAIAHVATDDELSDIKVHQCVSNGEVDVETDGCKDQYIVKGNA